MGQKAVATDGHIALPGTCGKEDAVELHRLLAERLEALAASEPAPVRAELDFSEVRELDACGCQLLALFMEHLRRRGIAACPCGLNGEVSNQITLLGFSDSFLQSENPGQR